MGTAGVQKENTKMNTDSAVAKESSTAVRVSKPQASLKGKCETVQAVKCSRLCAVTAAGCALFESVGNAAQHVAA